MFDLGMNLRLAENHAVETRRNGKELFRRVAFFQRLKNVAVSIKGNVVVMPSGRRDEKRENLFVARQNVEIGSEVKFRTVAG